MTLKKVTTILLMTLIVSTQTPLGQLLKLPLLIEHLIKHQKQGNISIIDFFQEHYSSQHNDQDLPEDEQLPFKNITFNSIGSAIVAPFVQTNEIRLLPSAQKVIYPECYTPQQHLACIFHPPRA